MSRLTSKDVAARDASLLVGPLAHAPTVTVGNVTIEVSDHARAVLIGMFDELAAGNRVDISQVAEMLTTQEAADLLRVSRPTLVKMLEEGLLPYERPGAHRRVPRAAVESFLATRSRIRKEALDALAQTHDPDGPDEIVSTR